MRNSTEPPYKVALILSLSKDEGAVVMQCKRIVFSCAPFLAPIVSIIILAVAMPALAPKLLSVVGRRVREQERREGRGTPFGV